MRSGLSIADLETPGVLEAAIDIFDEQDAAAAQEAAFRQMR
jgi:hypothetical protein